MTMTANKRASLILNCTRDANVTESSLEAHIQKRGQAFTQASLWILGSNGNYSSRTCSRPDATSAPMPE